MWCSASPGPPTTYPHGCQSSAAEKARAGPPGPLGPGPASGAGKRASQGSGPGSSGAQPTAHASHHITPSGTPPLIWPGRDRRTGAAAAARLGGPLSSRCTIGDKQQRPAVRSGDPAPTTQTPAPTLEAPASNEVEKEKLKNPAYTEAFGDKVGGFLWDQVRGNVTDEKIDGYLQQGGDAGAKWLHEQMLANAKPEDLARIQELGPHLKTTLSTGLVQPLQQSGLGSGVEKWAAENPWGMAGLGAAGLAAYVASDPKLSFDPRLGLGDHHSVTLGGDFGTLFDPRLDALRTGYRYKDLDSQLDLRGEARFDKDQWSIGGNYQQQTGWGQWSAFANHTNTDGHGLTQAGLNVDHKDVKAFLRGAYDGKEDLGTLSAGFSTLNKDGPVWTGGLDANTRGAWNANLGVSERRKDWEWFMKVGAGQNEVGKSDWNAQAGVRLNF